MMFAKFAVPTLLAVTAVSDTESALPDPHSFSSIGWVCVILVCIIVGLDKCFDAYKKHFKEHPEPSRTYLSVADFKEHQEKRDADLKEIKELIRGVDAQIDANYKALEKKIDDSNAYQYKARSRMHKTINAITSGFHYLCGLMSTKASSHLRGILKDGESESEEL